MILFAPSFPHYGPAAKHCRTTYCWSLWRPPASAARGHCIWHLCVEMVLGIVLTSCCRSLWRPPASATRGNCLWRLCRNGTSCCSDKMSHHPPNKFSSFCILCKSQNDSQRHTFPKCCRTVIDYLRGYSGGIYWGLHWHSAVLHCAQRLTMRFCVKALLCKKERLKSLYVGECPWLTNYFWAHDTPAGVVPMPLFYMRQHLLLKDCTNTTMLPNPVCTIFTACTLWYRDNMFC